MKRRRRWGIIGLAHFARVPVLLHILLTLNRIHLTDARDAKYLVVSSIAKGVPSARAHGFGLLVCCVFCPIPHGQIAIWQRRLVNW